jgi:hypothetical protein
MQPVVQVQVMQLEINTSSRPASRRLQFSLLSLFALTTLICLVLGWWVWPRPVEITSQLMATTRPIRILPLVGGTAPQVVDYQSKLLAALADPQLLKDAVAITGNGNLAMCRRSDPVGWIQKRLEITTSSNSVITIKLTVPEYFKKDAIEFVDYITLRAYSDVSIAITRQTRAWTRRLVRERDALALQLKTTTKRLNELDQLQPADAPEEAALKKTLASQRKSLAELEKDIDFSRNADHQVSNFQLVQNASVLDSGK